MDEKKTIRKIRRIASQARETCSHYIQKNPGRNYQLNCNNPVTLDCFCAIASVFLQKVLKNAGIETRLVTGTYKLDGHCWLEYNNHIIDITLRQFGRKEPFVSIRTCRRYYKVELETENIQVMFHGWPRGQYPNKARIGKLMRIHNRLAGTNQTNTPKTLKLAA
jgi:hypothetical protein